MDAQVVNKPVSYSEAVSQWQWEREKYETLLGSLIVELGVPQSGQTHWMKYRWSDLFWRGSFFFLVQCMFVLVVEEGGSVADDLGHAVSETRGRLLSEKSTEP